MITGQEYEVTRHAVRRSQQRGISPAVIRLVMDKADIDVHVGNGCCSLGISRKKLKNLRKDGIPPALLERCSDIFILIDPQSDTVITVFHGNTGMRKANLRTDHGHSQGS